MAFLANALHANLGTALQMQLGNPSGAGSDPSNQTKYLIQRAQYAIDYNNTNREPNWVAWNLSSADIGSSGRSDFSVDPTLPSGYYQVLTTDYSGSGYDRGHMCPSGDRTVTVADNQVTFYMSNMVPQAPDNNQGVWASFETYCRSLATAGNEVLIVTGPSGFAGSTIASGVAIPGYVWKIAVVVPAGSGTAASRITASTRVIALKIPNIAGIRSNPWQNYITSAAQLETDTGYTFFTDLSPSIRAALRTVVDGQTATGAPTIATQPAGQTAPVGGNASFSVVANGDAPLAYQWLKNDVEITGATAATLTLSNVAAADAATYTVVVSNSVGSVTSAGAALVLSGIPPSIVTSPTARTAHAGTATTFSVVAAGSPTLTYQWRKGGANLANGGNISGATTANLTLSNVQTADAAAYDVVVTNAVNGSSSATSASAALTVTPTAPTIVTAPASQSATAGGTVTFSVSATGTAPFTYQWRKGGTALTDGANIAGATTATLTVSTVATGDAGSYDVVVSNGVGTPATSSSATLVLATVTGSQVAYAGGTYSQNFDGLASSGTITLAGSAPFDLATNGLSGWRLGSSAGVPALTVGTGSSNAGGAYSYGSSGSSERALGTVASGSVTPRFGVMITNNSGTTITQFTLGYTGEQWRNGGNTAAHSLAVSYSLSAVDINASTGFTDVAALAFTSPTVGASAATLDGNATANRTAVSATVTGISWAPGQTLVLRWSDTNDSGNDHGLAVDDLTFTTPVGTAPVTPTIASTTPASGATGVAGNSAITVTFNQAVTVSGNWFALSSTLNGSLSATVTGGPTTYTITPPLSFADNDTVTVTFIATQITESATGTLKPTANTTLSFSTAAPVAPTVATPPQAATVNAGSNVTFTVAASGTAPFSYQWRKNGTAITGNTSATTATFTMTNVQATEAADYDVVVTNSVGSVTSAAAALAVTPVAPTVTTAPVAATATFGNNATFTVAASGTTPFTYQWRKGGVALANGTVANAATVSGATGATLTLAGVTNADAANYDVIVTNSVGSAPATTPVALTVNLPPAGPSINYAGGTYSQNFDTLPSSGTFTFAGTGPYGLEPAQPNGVGASGLAGWSFGKAAGSGSVALFKFDTGSSNAGGTNSYGASGASDRALGALGSGTFAARFGIALVNTTGSTLNEVTIGYTGEQWRRGSASANKLAFSYATGAVDLNTAPTAGFTAAAALDFTAPVTAGSNAALDGNLAANRVVVSPVTLTGLNWAAGQTLLLRWTDVDDSGSDDGLAIDDFTFTAAPAITTQPVARSATSGDSVTFAVATSATGATYQWRRNGTAITGNSSATTASLTVTASSALAGNYDCVVTNPAGSTTSSAVALTVTKIPVQITLGNLVHTYDGAAKAASATTAPGVFPVSFTYDGGTLAPVAAGSYAVVGTVATADAEGSAGGTLTIARAIQTVAFGSLPAAVSPGTAVTLAATASSGLPVAFSVVGGNATLAGNSITLLDTAPVTVRATQAGNSNYSPASADATLVASKLNQTIAFAAPANQLTTAGPVPLSATASSGLPVTFAVVSGPASLTGATVELAGTPGTVVVRATQPGNATFNAAPAVERSFEVTAARVPPRIAQQPVARTVLVGGSTSFSVIATGTPVPTFQWRKDGTPLAGATGATLALADVSLAAAGGYDVVVANAAGSVTSALARLVVNATPVAPAIIRQPGSQVVLLGRPAAFSVAATGAPAPTYQWLKDGTAIAGATGADLGIAAVAAADAGVYSVTVTNSAGTVASSPARLAVIRRSYAGTYFGTLGGGGNFAMQIGPENTGVFLAFAPGSRTAIVSRAVAVDDNGRFSLNGTATTGAAPAAVTAGEGPARAAATVEFSLAGSITEGGAISASGAGITLAGSRTADTGGASASAGFYQAGAAGSSASALVIVAPSGQALVVTQNGAAVDGGAGTVDAAGRLNVTTAGTQTISATVSADSATLSATVTATDGVATTLSGVAASSAAAAAQRIVNISTRTSAGTGEQVAIVGFVITGLESKTVLVRAVGPALRGFGVATALSAPRLELFAQGAAVPLAANLGWSSAANPAEIVHAAGVSGAFPLAAGSADSVILTTLAPGAYSAVVSASDGRTGVGLVEVYDLSGGAIAQRLANLSTRAVAGTGDTTLIAGLVIAGTAPKRVLLRAAGPALAAFGVANALSRPALALFSGQTLVAENQGWSASTDAAAIADAAGSAGAFAFAAGSRDAALIVHLAPGAYTAQVTGVGGATGIALVEVYELP